MGHYEALLELNPNDNQGVRHPLALTWPTLTCNAQHTGWKPAGTMLW